MHVLRTPGGDLTVKTTTPSAFPSKWAASEWTRKCKAKYPVHGQNNSG